MTWGKMEHVNQRIMIVQTVFDLVESKFTSFVQLNIRGPNPS